MQGFVYPNEMEIGWGLAIVLYPYITGLVAGAFIVSALYHVFRIQAFEPLARFSLLTALAFLIVAPLPLLLHLGRPERGFEIFITPHFTSAMSGFGYIWLSYFVVLVGEVWFTFREDIIRYAQTSRGLKRGIYRVLTLGVDEVSDRTKRVDHRMAWFLAALGIPLASTLHGYVGFIFSSIKANPWWSSPLAPFFFLLSAIVSGMALLLVLYVLLSRLRRTPLDMRCVRMLMGWLGAFLTVDLVFEGFEIVSLLYEQEESWPMIRQMLLERADISFFVIQVLLGTFLPLLLLAGSLTLTRSSRIKVAAGVTSALLIMVGVLAMRWNIVIGGQLISKSFRGLLEFTPPLWGPEGLIVTVGLLLLPFINLTIILYLLPPWDQREDGRAERSAGI